MQEGHAIRIVGGQAGGRRLVAPKGLATRPTGERVREALFNMLGVEVESATVLDLYAGSGALALEALSRGAASAWLIEPDYHARQAIKKNLAVLSPEMEVVVNAISAEQFMDHAIKMGQRFSLIFCDPPWKFGLDCKVIQTLSKITKPGGLVIVEHPASQETVAIPGLVPQRRRQWGDTAVSWYRLETPQILSKEDLAREP
ncbi:MAG: 16S rRNA (guanine(966)-N(2))-methyltransferase RsmD [Firmicutes bacterium]|nr:16S rRNA (guanine(966)-N(2))-methyltransferase RsmD [Bacillota bacterium]MCL5971059.1 16S rRNA (guanine(966)-N(2))-methyltransferase RsmD [Bacillota bacterium]